MPHHSTKATVAATFWCKPCGKPTLHSVFDGRRGACLECIARLEREKLEREKAEREAGPAAEVQGELF